MHARAGLGFIPTAPMIAVAESPGFSMIRCKMRSALDPGTGYVLAIDLSYHIILSREASVPELRWAAGLQPPAGCLSTRPHIGVLESMSTTDHP